MQLGHILTYTSSPTVPGDVAGPAIAVPVEISNASGRPLDLSNVVVTLVGADGDIASALSGQPTSPFTGTIADGTTSRAVYAFVVAESARDVVTVSVDYGAGVASVVFRGSAR